MSSPSPEWAPPQRNETRWAAALTVADQAADTAEARELLDMLGLLDVHRPRRRRPAPRP